jgi:hypothetical protein
MAKLQAVLDEPSFNAIEDDSLKSLYVQNTDTKQYFLDVDNGDALAFNLQKEVETLRNHNKTVLGEKKTIQEKVKGWEALGKSPEEIKSLLESNRPEELNKLIEKYDLEKKSLSDSFTESLNEATSKAERYQKQALNMALSVRLAQIRDQFDLNDTADFVLRNYYRAEETEDGQVVTRIYGDDGQPVLKAGQPITDEQFLNGFKEQKKFLSMFNSPNGGGTGATNRQTSHSGAKTLKRSEYDQMILDNPNQATKMVMQEGYKLVD